MNLYSIKKLIVISSYLIISSCGNTLNQQSNVPAQPEKKQPSIDKQLVSRWQLQSITSPEGVVRDTFKEGWPVNKLLLTINDKSIHFIGCNSYNAPLTTNYNNQFKVGLMRSTMRMCISRERFNADFEFSDYLQKTITYQRQGSSLKLITQNDDVLTFIEKPSPVSQYRGKGKIRFIEIFSKKNGITWKEKYYNKQANKKVSIMLDFPGIIGFKPKPNKHYVVRIKEFTDPKTNGTVWVKDLIVQQGVL